MHLGLLSIAACAMCGIGCQLASYIRHGVNSIPELELTLNSIPELELTLDSNSYSRTGIDSQKSVGIDFFIGIDSFGIGIDFVGIFYLILLIFTP